MSMAATAFSSYVTGNVSSINKCLMRIKGKRVQVLKGLWLGGGAKC